MPELLTAAFAWLRAADTRLILWAVVGGIAVQQVQIHGVQAQASQLRTDVDSLRIGFEAQLVLECLDSTKVENLRKARIPCAALFRKHGIAP